MNRRLSEAYEKILDWARTRSGNKEADFASTSRLDLLRPELNTILYEIALIRKEPEDTVEGWLEWCFVSDESCLLEFVSEESELNALRKSLNLPSLSVRDSFVELASQLKRRKPAGS